MLFLCHLFLNIFSQETHFKLIVTYVWDDLKSNLSIFRSTACLKIELHDWQSENFDWLVLKCYISLKMR